MKKEISIGEIVALDFRAASLKSLPELVFYTGKIASVHGDRHPELLEVASLFADINRELLQHLKNEEEVVWMTFMCMYIWKITFYSQTSWNHSIN